MPSVSKAPSATALVTCLHALADASGKAIRPYFRKVLAIDDKGGAAGFDPVTAADRAAERAILKHLKAVFPDHAVLGEEYGITGPEGARFKWVIDPIDGTRAFITGLPTWGTLIGLMDGERAVAGVMDQPFIGERYWAGASGAHFRMQDGKTRKLKTRACSSLAQAIFSTTHPDLYVSRAERRLLESVKSQTRMTRYGADCYAFCQLAAGFIDVIVEPGLKPYDIAALVPIIEKAGGVVVTWDGGNAANGGDVIACGDPALLGDVLALVAEARRK